MNRVWRIAGSGLMVVLALICGLVFSAARSDFTFRGCPDIHRDQWADSANCADGWLAQVMFGAAGLAMMLAAIVIWRWRGVS